MAFDSTPKQTLSVFSLIMIAIISVDSLRNLPIAAQYGFALVSFYLIAGCFFFLPLAWVTGRLAVQYPKTGGSYLWIRSAFGNRLAYVAIWLQWLYNMIWYPTIFAFITSTLGSLISPQLQNNPWFILITSLIFFWLLSLLHARGLRTTSWLSISSAIIGTLVPMFLIIVLAIFWLYTGNPSATHFHVGSLIPSLFDLKNIGFFSNILFSLLGLEVIAVHAANVQNPRAHFPKALTVSAILILLTISCSSLALCIIIPAKDIALVSGIMDVLNRFFAAYHQMNYAVLIGICIIIGGLGIASSWMIGLARGLHVSLCLMNAPLWLQKINKNQMPSGVLLLQALIYSALMCLFLFFPNINRSYWILSAITAQFALVYYILLFAAAIKLLRQDKRPCAMILNILLPLAACLLCFIGIIVAFIPPDFMG
jgi:amino acid transporter